MYTPISGPVCKEMSTWLFVNNLWHTSNAGIPHVHLFDKYKVDFNQLTENYQKKIHVGDENYDFLLVI